jgi:Ca2+-binding RTX toxin-like protein
VETLVYGDGSTLNISTNLTLFAQSGNSTLSGTGGTDTLIAVNGAGTETLLGSGGNDVYSYTAGNGNVIINENGSNSAADTLKPASGLTSANVSFTETSNGSDLIITDGTSGDQITIKLATITNNSTSKVETLVYGDGTTLNMGSGGLPVTAASGTSTLNGVTGNDTLMGSSGTQTLNGDGGNDIFIDGTGTITALGGSGNDIFSYASGDGTFIISASSGTDTLKLASGLTSANVSIAESTNGSDLLITDGTGGDLITVSGETSSGVANLEMLVYGNGSTFNLASGGFTLTATTGSSTLNGDAGNDTLIAVNGSGTETLRGNAGNDLYSYTAGNGVVVINENGGNSASDTLKLSSIVAADVTFTETNGADMVITDGTGGDQMDLINQTNGTGSQIETLVYGDGSTQNISTNLTLYAQSGNATVSGTSGADTLIAVNGSGTEMLFGGAGNDTYSYTAGNGKVVISEGNANSAADTLKLDSSLTSANVTFSESSNGSDLIILDGTSGDQVTITNAIVSSPYQVETLKYGDGSTLNLTTPLTVYAPSGNATLKGTNGNDTLIAVNGSGTETLLGAAGNDIYSYTAGNGKVLINEAGNNSAADTLKLASSLTASNVFFSESSNGADLIITDTTSGDQITITNAITTASYRVETLVYSDGSTLNLTTAIGAGSAATTLNGTTGNDIMIPDTANLTLAGKGGNDLYDFGRGMGHDYINNGVSTTNSANGTLFFGHGIGDNQLWFDRVDNGGTISTSGNNLRIDIMGTTTSMTINGWYIGGSSTYEQLSEFELSDNGLKLDSQLANLVSAMATFETNYKTAHGGTAFDPTAVSSISDTTVLAAVSSDWA